MKTLRTLTAIMLTTLVTFTPTAYSLTMSEEFKRELRETAKEKYDRLKKARKQREEFYDLAVVIFQTLGKRLTRKTRKNIEQTAEYHTYPEAEYSSPWGQDETYTFAQALEKMRQHISDLKTNANLKQACLNEFNIIKGLESTHEKLHIQYDKVAKHRDSRSDFPDDEYMYHVEDFMSLQDLKDSNAYRRKHNNELKVFIAIEKRRK